MLDDPSQPMREVALTAEVEMAIAVANGRALPDQASGDRIGTSVVLQALFSRPPPADIGQVCKALATSFGHARTISAQHLNYLLWAMAFSHRP